MTMILEVGLHDAIDFNEIDFESPVARRKLVAQFVETPEPGEIFRRYPRVSFETSKGKRRIGYVVGEVTRNRVSYYRIWDEKRDRLFFKTHQQVRQMRRS